jgi:hypothetical protein
MHFGVMKQPTTFDFWYAVNNTEIVTMPTRHLETFGATMLNYHLVSELMDSVNQIRVRQGRMQAHRPQIITPESYSATLLEGFGEEASKYVDWLRKHEKQVRILQYGYRLKQESFSEQVVSDNIRAVVERVQAEVKTADDPFSAVVVGVDKPWDVCLVKLFWEVIQKSAAMNVADLERRHMFDQDGGVPKWLREEIDQGFLAASRDSALIKPLAATLQKHGLFEEYQDRFFALVKASQ